MKALVIGYGSIGIRHARLLTSLGCEVAVVSSRDVEFPAHYHTLADALSWKPEYVVIANRTSQHYKTLTELAELGFTGTVLIEKPLFHEEEEFPRQEFKRAFVGYNLRFHPILQIFRAHRGVDLSAPAGTRIVAPAEGTVTSVGWRLGYGLTIELAHSGGVTTRYAHCRSAMVHRGDHVAIGQAFATVGSSGLATAPHLHFEVLVHGTNVDPIKFLASTHTSALSAPAPAAGHE